MPDIIYILFIFMLLYFCCLPRFEGFTGGNSPLSPLFTQIKGGVMGGIPPKIDHRSNPNQWIVI